MAAAFRSNQADMNLFLAEQEMELVTTLFNNMVDSCLKKCIPTTYIEGEMNKGESVCTDRCISKYFLVSNILNKRFAESNNNVQQQLQQ